MGLFTIWTHPSNGSALWMCLSHSRLPLRTRPCRTKKLCLRWRRFCVTEFRKALLMAIKTYGSMAVDWEQRIDFDRLRRERLARIKAMLKQSEMGALLCFDMNNVRYITATHIGTWAQDKINRF